MKKVCKYQKYKCKVAVSQFPLIIIFVTVLKIQYIPIEGWDND